LRSIAAVFHLVCFRVFNGVSSINEQYCQH
jgi:hypothetical protein